MRLIFFTVLIISSALGHAATISCESSSELRFQKFSFDSAKPNIFLKTQIKGLPEKTITYISDTTVCETPINFQTDCTSKEDPTIANQIGAKFLFSFSCNNGLRGNITFEDGNVVTVACTGLPHKIIGNCILKNDN